MNFETIIDCGLNAPSGSNRQDVKIIVTQDEDKVKRLSGLSQYDSWSK